MYPHPSADVRQARDRVAARLRELRLDAGISGRELAARSGWSESKSSRIENARTLPSDSDLRAWCAACHADDQSADLIAANRQSAEAYVQWRRLQRTGLRQLQESGTMLYERTARFRVYCSDVIPGFLQTPEYAKALLASIAAFRGTPDDVKAAVAARMRRNRVVHDGKHRFSILLEEAVLHHRMGGGETMAAQLNHLLDATMSANIALGVIPFTAERTIWPLPTFTIFDAERVHADSLDAAVTLVQPGQVALYSRAFDALARDAVRGADARLLISGAAESLRG